MGRVIEMPLPRLGETMEEGRIGLIIKKPGEAFKRGETLLEVESDMSTNRAIFQAFRSMVAELNL